MNCKNCGTALKPDTVFCPNCGEKVVSPDKETTVLVNNQPTAGYSYVPETNYSNPVQWNAPQPQPPQKKANTGLIAAVIVIAVIIIVGIAILISFSINKINKNAPETTNTVETTSTVGTTNTVETTVASASPADVSFYVSYDTPQHAGLVVRKNNTYYSDKITVLSEGTPIRVISTEDSENEYILISFNLNNTETRGWVLKKYIISTTSSYAIGDIIVFGSYEQDGNLSNGKEPIEWIVFNIEKDHSNGTVGYKYHLVSKEALDAKPYNTTAESVTWATSSLRKWLNNEFLSNAFSATELKSVCFFNEDRVRCLSTDSVNNLSTLVPKKTTATKYAQMNGAYIENGHCGYWLIDSGDTYNTAARVNVYGQVLTSYNESIGGVERTDFAVRPVITIF